MKYDRKLRALSETTASPSVLEPEIEAKLHHVLDALECMDARTARELELLAKSCAEEDLKEVVRQEILSRHNERRLPLQEAAEELRVQHRTTLSDLSS